MRESDEFIVIREKNLDKFIKKLDVFDFIDALEIDKTQIESFLKKYCTPADSDEDAYFLIRENSFIDWLKKHEVSELQHKKIVLLLKSFSELPNSIYLYPIKDETYKIFK